jgi:SAM-dependent methyltransferase
MQKRICGSVDDPMRENDLKDHLICPDCKEKIAVADGNRLFCTRCGRSFDINQNVIQMLPSTLERNYEDEAWKTLPHEGIDKPAWMAIMHKKDRILYFYEKILPKFDFTGKILEIGAGMCWASALIKKKHPHSLVVASDISPYALEKGSEVAQLLDSTIDYRISCDAERLPFSDEYFDMVLSNATIHHFANPQQGLCEMWRVLKRGGKCFALGELAAGQLFTSILMSRLGIAGRRARSLGIEENIYNLRTWKRFFETCGFSSITVDFDKTWVHKLYSRSVALYYRLLAPIPNMFIGDLLPCNVDIYAKKS